MLFVGIKEIRNNLLIITSFVLVLLSIAVLFVGCKKEQFESNNYYENKFFIKESKIEFIMKNVFEFEFDKAYIASETYGDKKYFLKKLNADADIDIPMLESGAHNRILFIKDDKIIYDFIYEIGEISFVNKEIFVYPDTQITILRHNSINDGKFFVEVEVEVDENTGDGSLS